MGAVLRNSRVLVVSLGHMTVDMFSSSLPVLLAVLAVNLGLSNVGIGTVAMIFTLAASVTQPLFGLAADRWDTRWIGIGGLLWLAGGFALAAVLPGPLGLLPLMAAGLGSGAYHPQGSLNARRAAGRYAASGTSLFFFFGMTGHAIGPVLSGILLVRLSLPTALLILAALALPVALLFARFAPQPKGTPVLTEIDDGEQGQRVSWTPVTVAAYVLVLFFYSWPMAATGTFLPKWLSDAGFSSDLFGGLLGSFMIASAVGNLFGGALADRWSRKGTVVAATAASPLAFYAIFSEPSVGLGALAAVAAAGFLIGMPNPVLVLMGQNLFPRRMGLASGLVLGFSFCMSALATWLTGWLGDQVGLPQALLLVPWISGLAAVCALALPRTRVRPGVVAAPVPGD